MLRFFPLTIFLMILGFGSTSAQLQLTNAFPSLSFTDPIFLTNAGDGTNRIFVAQQNGLIKVFPNDSTVTAATTFLNITNKLSSTTGEQGLLGLAFHPDYEANGHFYVNYTTGSSATPTTTISRFSVTGDPNKADSLSEEILLEMNQPYWNHNGGMVMFGTDGYLYIGVGDGGSGGDPQNNGQNTQTLLGNILRIDVDTTQGYRIPPSNPFFGDPGAGREEIFAWGYRNPWRFSQDTATGLIYVGDVGQGSWEEVDILENGLNYGWRCYEGNTVYNSLNCGPVGDYTFPIKVYPHGTGDCSITGGYVYEGYRRPELVGAYIYGDYCTGRTWMLRYEGGEVTEDSLLIDAPFLISSFGVDEDGELYFCNYSGNIQRFVGFPPNEPPGEFDLVSPASDTTFVFDGVQPEVMFVWEESVDPDTQEVQYTVEFDTVVTFNSGAFMDTLVGTPTQALVELPRDSQRYHWRVRASDGIASTLSSTSRTVNITYINNPPSAFGLSQPPDDTTIVFVDKDPFVFFVWETSEDPDSDFVSYVLQVDTTATFDSPVRGDSLAGGITTLGVAFPTVSDTYYWRVIATDGRDSVLSNESRSVHIEFATSVLDEEEIPLESSLDQNFPNPFNPTTTITYSIRMGGHIRLAVYNLLGQVVAVLYEGVRSAGSYEAEFRSDDIPSGIYFYRLEAEGYVETRKMVIAK